MQIKLVPFDREMVGLIHRVRQQEPMLRYNPIVKIDEEEILARMSSESADLSEFSEKENFRWFAEYEDKIVGNVALTKINRMMGFAEIGYALDEKYYGKGIGTVLVSLAIEMIFAETPLRKITAYVHDENIASRRLLERLGFVREGLLRDHFIINGKLANEVFYGLLKDEFQPVSKK